MQSFSGKVAAVTGAGSGIGRSLARQLAQHRCHLALSDIDETSLAETVTLCEGHGVKVTSQRLDVADHDAVEAWAAQVIADHGKVNLIFNNAGVALIAEVSDMSLEDHQWLMSINYWGVVHGTRTFLPHLEASGDGHVVNISSVFGLLAIPGQAAYNSAKFAVRGYTDALRMELEAHRSPVSATTVHPGGIRTNIVRNARVTGDSEAGDPDRFDKIARTTPDQAAEAILAGIRKNKRRVLIGPDARAFDLISRLPAGISQRLLITGARRARR